MQEAVINLEQAIEAARQMGFSEADQESLRTAHGVSAFRLVMNYTECRVIITPDRSTDRLFVLRMEPI